MAAIYAISSAGIPPVFLSERRVTFGLPCRLLALMLLSLVLIFSVFFVPQRSVHLNTKQGQEEILQAIPTLAATEAIVFEDNALMGIAVYFLLYAIYCFYHQNTALTYALKESLSVLTFLRNPFYVFTSIHAP